MVSQPSCCSLITSSMFTLRTITHTIITRDDPLTLSTSTVWFTAARLLSYGSHRFSDVVYPSRLVRDFHRRWRTERSRATCCCCTFLLPCPASDFLRSSPFPRSFFHSSAPPRVSGCRCSEFPSKPQSRRQPAQPPHPIPREQSTANNQPTAASPTQPAQPLCCLCSVSVLLSLSVSCCWLLGVVRR